VLMVLDTTVITVNGVQGKGTGAIKGNGEMAVKNSIRLKHLTPLQRRKDIRNAATQDANGGAELLVHAKHDRVFPDGQKLFERLR
ncbi:MAG: hypothetical protein OXC62_09750, partial [Aestuariivita sp.]|nr:hypothetical protein [Aestuariivita sp.]